MPPPPKKPKLPKIDGTNLSETIVGSDEPDQIDGKAGDDLIFGYATPSGVPWPR